MGRFGRWFIVVGAFGICGCVRDGDDAKRSGGVIGRAALRAGQFRVSALENDRYLASTDDAAPECRFEFAIVPPKAGSRAEFAFSRGALVRQPAADCTRFLEGLATVLQYHGALPKPETVKRVDVDLSVLGTDQSPITSAKNEPGRDCTAGCGYARSPPGSWTTTKLFFGDDEGEVFLDFSARDGLGEFSLKDEDYATYVMTELAKVLLPSKS